MIYEAWFKSFDLKGKKVFRIKGTDNFKNKLGQIQDISGKDFEELVISATSGQEKKSFEPQKDIFKAEKTDGERRRLVKKLFVEWSETDDFCKEMFPADSIMLGRAAQADERAERKKIIAQKKDKLLRELFGGLQ